MRTTEQLVSCAQRGDQNAFAELLARFEGSALSTAYSILLNPEAARDAAQEGAMKAWQNIGRLLDPARFGGWFCGIVRNAAFDLKRKTKVVLEVRTEKSLDPAAAASQKEIFSRITETLEMLDETTRAVVMMRYFEDLSSKQIGAVLEISPAAVDMRLARARNEMRALLVEHMPAARKEGVA